MVRRIPLLLIALVCLTLPARSEPAASRAAPAVTAGIPSPESFLGFPVGADRKLADYGKIVGYLETLARSSDRVRLDTLGATTLGRPLVMAVISSATNLREADRWREVARRLADPRALGAAEADRLVAEGKVVLLVGCSIHSSEIGGSQMALEWAHALATTSDPAQLGWLDDVILLLVPSLNPDGTDMVVDWYRKYVGTPWEGGRMPWLYHHYAGHDDNRDWFMLDLAETRLVNRVLHHVWFPQVFLDEHQMGQTSPRIFVPPYTDPITPLVHPLQWRLTDLMGTNMAWRFEQAGKSGVIQSFMYDAYWPGGTKNTACLKNVIGLLTETASCRVATPVFVDPSELSGGAKGLADYRVQSNFPHPWPGGWWRLRDIVDYELIASNSLLETCSRYRADILRACLDMAREQVRLGTAEAPYAYVIPPGQRDPAAARRMIAILEENGLEAHQAGTAFTTADGRSFPAGSVVFLAAQPYRAFLLEMMERQRYPEVRPSPDSKEIDRPYDVTAWTLPLMMGVDWARVERPFTASLTRLEGPPQPMSAREVAGSCLVASASSSASPALVNRLLAKGARVERALEAFSADGRSFAAGDWLLPASEVPEARDPA
ncbi:MAG TPA: M14 metallopeptidase family protein, partial [Terriglobales bacterium]|nr:M14 metallopeptidase family protein [Terriglobales bacterium]